MISIGTSITVTTEPTPPEPRLRDNPDFTNNLVFCYECDDDAASSTVIDSSPNGYDGTLIRDTGVVFEDVNTEDYTITGHIGSAFDGTKDGVNNSTAVDFTAVEGGVQGSVYNISNYFSWSMWVKWPTNTSGGPANSRATYDCLIGNWGGGGGYCQIQWYDIGGGDWRIRWLTFDGSFRGVYTSTDISTLDDTFFHLAATWDASAGNVNVEDGMKLYVNNSDVTVKVGTAGVPSNGFDNTTWIYNHRPDANYPGRFDLDQFCGHSKTIDSTLISTIYNGGNGMAY